MAVEERNRISAGAAHSLVELCDIFAREYDLPNGSILMDGLNPGEWLMRRLYSFDHRVHISVKKP
jgi:hypothetical protein